MSNDFDELDRLLANLDSGGTPSVDSTINADDRNPVLDAAKAGGASALSRIFPKGRRDEVIIKALPDTFTNANETFREVKYAATDLYSHTKEQLVQTEQTLKRKAAMLAPRLKSIAPKSTHAKIDNFVKSQNQSYSWGDSSDPIENKIQQMLNDTFRPTEQFVSSKPSPQEERLDNEQRAKDEIKRFATDSRQMEQTDSTKNIESYIQRIYESQNNSLTWKRKSLEVGIRQLFAMSDMLNVVKASNDKLIPAIEAIVKNTGLPDYAKETNTEIIAAMSKRRLVESINPAEYARNFISDSVAKAKRSVSNVGTDIRSGLDFADLLAMDDGLGDDKTEEERQADAQKQIARTLGGMLAQKYIIPQRDKALGKIKERMSKSDRVNDLGEKLKYYSGNVSSIYNTELTDETDDSILKSLANWFSETKEGYNGENIRLAQRGEDYLNAPSVPDNRLYITQTEIIPAYLRSIDSAVWRLNGEERDNVYDLTTRSFVSAKEFGRTIRKNVSQSTQKQLYDNGLDSLVRDFDGDEELSEDGRAQLKQYFHDRVSKNKTFDIKSLASDENMQEVLSNYEDIEIFERKIEELAEENLFENMNRFADRIKRIRHLAGGYQNEVNRIATLHGEKSLVDAGVFERNQYGGLTANKGITDPTIRFEEELEENNTTSPRTSKFAPRAADAVKPDQTINVDNKGVETKLSSIIDLLRNPKPRNDNNSAMDSLLKHSQDGTLELTKIVTILQDLKVSGIKTNYSQEYDREQSGTGPLKRGFGDGIVGSLKGIPKSIANFTSSTLSGGWNLASKGVRSLLGGAKDVYDERGKKVLSGAKLKTGEYWTVVNGKMKQIFTIDEIGEYVMDEDGNEILSEDDVANAGKFRFMKDGTWTKLAVVLNTKLSSLAVGGVNAISSTLTGTASTLANSAKWAKDKLFSLPDIYVKGETTVRLKAAVLKAGGYFCNGKVIKSGDDITGEVTDKDGNVIITAEEFASKGFTLITRFGDEVKTRFNRMASRMAQNHRDSKAMVGKVLGFAKDKALGLASGASKLFGRLRGKKKTDDGVVSESIVSRMFGGKSKTTTTNDLLTRIFNLLNRRLPGDPEEDIVTKAVKASRKPKADSNVKDRNIFERMRRNGKARKMRKERSARGTEPKENKVSSFIKTKQSSIKEAFSKPLDTPEDTFKRSAIKVGANDPQLTLLKRIADSSEGNWIKGLTAEADELGVDSSFKQQMLLRFSKRFKGGVSRMYRNLAGAKPQSTKAEDIVNSVKGKDKSDNSMGSKLMGLLGGLGDVLKGGLSKILSGIGASIGVNKAADIAGDVLGGMGGKDGKTAKKSGWLKKGAKAAATVAGFGVRGLVMGGSAAMSIAGSALTAVGGVISAPVVLGAAVVGGIGYLAYKHLSKVNPTIPGRVRFAQYGCKDYNNWSEEDSIKLIYLEEELKSFVKKGSNGYVVQGLTKEKITELSIGYGCDEGNEIELNEFVSWLLYRFIPIFVLWYSRMADNGIGCSVQGIETAKLPLETQKALINGIRLPANHPIFAARDNASKVDRNFIMKFSDWVGFTTRALLTGEEVAGVTGDALRELDVLIAAKKTKDAKDKETTKKNAVIEKGKLNFAKSMPTSPTKNNPVEQAARMAMFKNKDGAPKHLGSVVGVEGTRIALDEKPQMASGAMLPIELARWALYGIERPTEAAIESLRNIDRIAGDTINTKTKVVDDSFYDKALPFTGSLGITDPDIMRSWLRERVAPMYMAYIDAITKVVGKGAQLKANISTEVYSVLLGLVNTTVQGVSIVRQPSNVDFIGKYFLLKESAEVTRLLISLKPDDKAIADKKDAVTFRKSVPLAKREWDKAKKTREASVKSSVEASTTKSSSNNIKMPPMRQVTSTDKRAGSGEYSEFSKMKLGSKEDIAILIGKIAEAQGMDPELLITTAMIESSLNPEARPPKGSAKGLFQFLNGTWDEQMKKHGNRLGIPSDAKANDPVAATLLAAEYFRGNSKSLDSSNQGVVDLYMTHFLGAGGASKFFRNMKMNPTGYAADDFAKATKNNAPVFLNSDGTPKTYQEIYRSFAKKFVSRSSQVPGITGGMYGGGATTAIANESLLSDNNRTRVITNKAKSDVKSSQSSAEAYTAIRPDGRKAKATVAMPSPKVIDTKVSNFQSDNPSVTTEDAAKYKTAVEEAYKETPKQEASSDVSIIDRLIKSGESNTSLTNTILNKSLLAQEGMYSILHSINEKLALSLSGNDNKQALKQMAIQDSKLPKPKPTPIDLSKRVINVSRNKNV